MSQSRDRAEVGMSPQGHHARSRLFRMIMQGRSLSGHERNCCFLNTGTDRFANVSAISGLDYPDDGRAVALVDWDHDGDMDMWTSNRNAPRLRLLINSNRRSDPGGDKSEKRPTNHFLAFRLHGNGTTTNRDGIGARVELTARGLGDKRLVKALRAGEGFLSQSSKWLHFGLGPIEQIDTVRVNWPDGSVQEFTDLNADRRYHLDQGHSQARLDDPRPGPFAVVPKTYKLPVSSGHARIPLVVQLPMPDLEYQNDDGSAGIVKVQSGRAVLVNLWSESCRPCVLELKEIAEREQEIRDANLDVVALRVDARKTTGEKTDAPRGIMEQIRFPFTYGWADPQVILRLQEYHDNLILMRKPLPLPSSFLIDGQGRLAAIYIGRLSVDDLLQDVRHSDLDRQERMIRSASLPGRTMEHELIAQIARKSEAAFRFRIAGVIQEAGRLEEAARHYDALLQIEPTYRKAHYNLGVNYFRRGMLPEAARYFEEAIGVEPGDALAHVNLGIMLGRLGRFDDAIRYYQKAIELQPNHADAHYNLGLVLARQGKLETAISHFREAVRIQPQSAKSHNNLGSALALQGDLHGAIEHFEHSVRIDPRHGNASTNLKRARAQLEAKEARP